MRMGGDSHAEAMTAELSPAQWMVLRFFARATRSPWTHRH
jgi:hypothetical protein